MERNHCVEAPLWCAQELAPVLSSTNWSDFPLFHALVAVMAITTYALT